MFLHPLFLIFVVLVVVSTILVVSSASWVISWVFLEVNLMIFVPRIIQRANKYAAEAAIKYFITQAIASVVILLSISYFNYINTTQTYIIVTALLIKLGLAPAHFWFINVSTAISWPANFVLIVPQKIIPLVLVNSITPVLTSYLTTPFVVLTLAAGSLGALITSNIKKIMAYSSIVHRSWIIRSIPRSNSVWFTYLTIYSLILVTVVYNLILLNINKIRDIYNKNNNLPKIILLLSILSLAGLPPFSGFFMKLIIINHLTQTHLYYLISALLLSSLVSLFFYRRIAFTRFNASDKTKIKISFNKEKKSYNIIITLNLLFLLAGTILVF